MAHCGYNNASSQRVIAHLDVDSFEVHIRGKECGLTDFDIETKPICVYQYQNVVAVNEAARTHRVERMMSVMEANQLCPNLIKIARPEALGKPEVFSLRLEGDRIYDCIASTLSAALVGEYFPVAERLGNDEVYLDLTDEVRHRMHSQNSRDRSHSWQMHYSRKLLVEYSNRTLAIPNCTSVNVATESTNTHQLLIGADLVSEILDYVKGNLGYTLSAGVGSNKLLAKLACKSAKPNGLAVYPLNNVARFSQSIPLTWIPGLGGQAGGTIMDYFGIQTMSELSELSFDMIVESLGPERENWAEKIYNQAVGLDQESVVRKTAPASLSSGRTFRRDEIRSGHKLQNVLYNLYLDMKDILQYDFRRNNKRVPKKLNLSVEISNNQVPYKYHFFLDKHAVWDDIQSGLHWLLQSKDLPEIMPKLALITRISVDVAQFY